MNRKLFRSNCEPSQQFYIFLFLFRAIFYNNNFKSKNYNKNVRNSLIAINNQETNKFISVANVYFYSHNIRVCIIPNLNDIINSAVPNHRKYLAANHYNAKRVWRKVIYTM